MRESLKLVIRDPSDIGKERKMITPCPETILRNTDTFRRQWGNTSVKGQLVLPEAALKALDNLRNHAGNRCLCDIPVSCGTNRNENLHNSVKSTIKQGKIGIQLAVSLLGSYFYKWNERKLRSNRQARQSSSFLEYIPPVEHHFYNASSAFENCAEKLGTDDFTSNIIDENDGYSCNDLADDLNRIDDINCSLGKLRDQTNPSDSCESHNNTSECNSDGPNFAKECNEKFLLTFLEVADLFQQAFTYRSVCEKINNCGKIRRMSEKNVISRKPGSHCFIMRVQLMLCHHK